MSYYCVILALSSRLLNISCFFFSVTRKKPSDLANDLISVTRFVVFCLFSWISEIYRTFKPIWQQAVGKSLFIRLRSRNMVMSWVTRCLDRLNNGGLVMARSSEPDALEPPYSACFLVLFRRRSWGLRPHDVSGKTILCVSASPPSRGSAPRSFCVLLFFLINVLLGPW